MGLFYKLVAKLVGEATPALKTIAASPNASQRASNASFTGRPLAAAMKAFVEFVGPQPLFFHNAPFDQGFLKKAAARAKVKLNNETHDTLPLARHAWPSPATYKLSALAEHVSAPAPAPNHRALEDAKAALAVLLAARATVAQ